VIVVREVATLMENIVAVAVRIDTGEDRYFLTWGRLHDPVDPEPLEALILSKSSRFALGGRPVSARHCLTLQEAAAQPYFYECFFSMCQKVRSRDRDYDEWAEQTRQLMAQGKEIYYLGQPPAPPTAISSDPRVNDHEDPSEGETSQSR
jgi:hypothetical protein